MELNWQFIISTTIFSTIFSTILTFLFKDILGGIFQSRLDKGLATQKASLDAETEKLKYDLHRTATMLSNVQKSQFDFYRELWKEAASASKMIQGLNGVRFGNNLSKLHKSDLDKMIAGEEFADTARIEFNSLYANDSAKGIEHIEKLQRGREFGLSREQFAKARSYLDDNEILIPAESAKHCKEALDKVWALYAQYHTAEISKGYSPDDTPKKQAIEEAFDNLRKVIRKELGVLETESR